MEEKTTPEVIYEDQNILVLDKPAGWVTTKENNHSERNIERWLEKMDKNNLPRQGIVHRLDKGTSGVLIVAKNSQTLADFKKRFRQRQVEKRYLAWIEGDLPAEGDINLPIGRSKYNREKFQVSEAGKKAQTKFKVLRKINIGGRIHSLVDVNLITGRTHQIRVHFSHLGWPIVGDVVYGSKNKTVGRPELHCYQIKIAGFTFESPFSENFYEKTQ
ncbi:MAG TPA: RluA family pseudouridine synthase [Candidatus Woesebacteria bacterium]|nr:RluA family pseudouridine synthase [Candidatus Woesebacteria bacterium]